MKKGNFKKGVFVLWVIIVGSFIGFIHENLYMFFKGSYSLRQGLLYEPLIPIYGVGLAVFYLVYSSGKFPKKNKPLEFLCVFLVGFFLGGLTEFVGSFLQERIFGTVSWDYSSWRFDLNGRTSLFHSVCWGLGGILYYVLLMKPMKRLERHFDERWFQILTFVFASVFLVDSVISFAACYRRSERRNDLPPSNAVEVFLDEHYPDSIVDKIYNNARVRKKADDE